MISPDYLFLYSRFSVYHTSCRKLLLYFKPILQMLISFHIYGISAIWHILDIRLRHHHHSPKANRYYHSPAIPRQCQSPVDTVKLNRSPQEESQVIMIILKWSGFKYFHKDVLLFSCMFADPSSCSPTCCSDHSSAVFRHWSLCLQNFVMPSYLAAPVLTDVCSVKSWFCKWHHCL